jgi:hypothetical protein
MRLPKVLWIVILTQFACSSEQQNSSNADTSLQLTDTSHDINQLSLLRQDLNKKHINESGSYYMLTKQSDSTIQVIWGNDTLKREYSEPLEFMFAERIHKQWSNNDYLILQYGTGTGAWQNLVLSLNSREPVQVVDNALSFDSAHNILAVEQFGDTVFTVYNLKTQQRQFIIERARPCGAAQNSACIDTVSVNNKELYYKWATPHRYSDRKRSLEKRVRLTI